MDETTEPIKKSFKERFQESLRDMIQTFKIRFGPDSVLLLHKMVDEKLWGDKEKDTGKSI